MYSIDQDKVGMGRAEEVFKIFKIALLKAKSRNHFPMAGYITLVYTRSVFGLS